MHYILDWIVAILTILYALLLMAYHYWFGRLHYFKKDSNLTPDFANQPTHFTVVIPARNESANIKICVDAILAQNYPIDFFEIIVIDDFSEDDTASIVNK